MLMLKIMHAELASAWRQWVIVGSLKWQCCFLLKLESSSAIRIDD